MCLEIIIIREGQRERESKRPIIDAFALSIFLFLAAKRGVSNF